MTRIREWWNGLWTDTQCPYQWSESDGIGYFTWYCQRQTGHFGKHHA